MKNGEVVALSLPCKEGSTEFVGWGGVPLSLRCVEVKSHECVNVRSVCGGSLVKEFGDSLVDFSNNRGFDKKKDSGQCGVLTILVKQSRPMA